MEPIGEDPWSIFRGERLADKKKRELEHTVAALQDRWGDRAIRRLGSDRGSSTPHVPTGFPALDQILDIGGLPRGRISEIVAVPTSGAATIALKVAANAQKEIAGNAPMNGPNLNGAIYVDLDSAFDPEYAARCGLDLSQMILVRPVDMNQALAIVRDFILAGGLSLLIFDTPLKRLAEPRSAQRLATTLDQIIAPLGRTQCLLLFLTSLPVGSGTIDAYPSQLILPHYAAVRLLIQRQRWLYKKRDISGYQAEVVVIKNKLGPTGKSATVAITLNGNSDASP